MAVEGGGARRARDEPGLGPKPENTGELTEQESCDGDERDPQQHVDLSGDVISEQEVAAGGAGGVVIGDVAVGIEVEKRPDILP